MTEQASSRALLKATCAEIERVALYRHDFNGLFRDMVSAMCLTLRNANEPKDDDWARREREYLETVGRYECEVVDLFARTLGNLMLVTRDEHCDLLGELYMTLASHGSRKGLGQHFTPFHISKMMATMTMTREAIEQAIAEKGFISVNEPSCGSGGMVIAVASAMADLGYDIASKLYVVAQDIDLHCARMTYVSCALYGIPATIIHGDTLKMEERSRMHSPALIRAVGWPHLAAAA